MAATGVLAEAVNAVTTQLTALSLPWTTDPRNVRPGSVLVDLPQSENFTYNVANINLTLHICAAPPANLDAANYLLTTADTIMNSPIAITSMRPSSIIVGGQDLPTYDLNVAVAVRRN